MSEDAKHVEMVDEIARAVLYEGYVLYPYRPSTKNVQRWTFGGVFPETWSAAQDGDPSHLQAQCLVVGGAATRVSVNVRFLHLTDRAVEQAPNWHRVRSIRIGNEDFQTWQEAVEREIAIEGVVLADLAHASRRQSFSFPYAVKSEDLRENERLVGRLVREQREIAGAIELSARPLAENLTQLTVRVTNQTPIEPTLEREQALMRSLASTHLVSRAGDGQFVSLTDPPPAYGAFASQCQNVGCWPVLVGEANRTDALLASPIILPDYPRIAPQSPGDLFDGCEIDEILTLRIMTLTDEEKQQAAAVDDRVRKMLDRTQTLAREQLMNLHGAVRGLTPVKS